MTASNTRRMTAMLTSLVAIVCALTPAPAGASLVGHAFTYQGFLEDGGTPANGMYEFMFIPYDAQTGGATLALPVGPITLQVDRGIFSAELEFESALFSQPRLIWLEVEARPAGTGDFTVLPRQKVNPAPYAVGLSLPYYGRQDGDSPPFSMVNFGAGGTILAIGKGVGRDNATLEVRNNTAAGGMCEYIHNNSTYATAHFQNDGSGQVLWLESAGSGTVVNATGRGQGSANATVRVLNTQIYQGMCQYNWNSSDWATAHFQNDGTGEVLYLLGVAGSAIRATGSGTTKDHATVQIENTNPQEGMCQYVHNNSTFATCHFQNDGSGGVFWLEQHGNGNYITASNGSDWKFWVDAFGMTHTKSLEILGGSDLSEKFSLREEQGKVEPGMLVSIDPKREGGLVVCASAYDRRVAGVVSGAGGVVPGMLMGQKGSVADGDYPVALTGRVYCWVDAAYAPIEPGDLLVSSPTRGHAMKASDAARAPGATIGKAMGSLASGRGLVLVLVSLQ